MFIHYVHQKKQKINIERILPISLSLFPTFILSKLHCVSMLNAIYNRHHHHIEKRKVLRHLTLSSDVSFVVSSVVSLSSFLIFHFFFQNVSTTEFISHPVIMRGISFSSSTRFEKLSLDPSSSISNNNKYNDNTLLHNTHHNNNSLSSTNVKNSPFSSSPTTSYTTPTATTTKKSESSSSAGLPQHLPHPTHNHPSH